MLESLMREEKSKTNVTETVIDYTYKSCNIIIPSMSLILMLAVFGIVVATYADAQATIDDLKQMIPEARDTLRMVKNICSSPAFKQYCE